MNREYTLEECLDAVLAELEKGWYVNFTQLNGTISLEHQKHAPLMEMLHALRRDRYVVMEDSFYLITVEGKSFLKEGGYVARKKRENLNFQMMNQNLKWAKVAGIGTIVAIAISLIGLIISVIK